MKRKKKQPPANWCPAEYLLPSNAALEAIEAPRQRELFPTEDSESAGRAKVFREKRPTGGNVTQSVTESR